MPTKTNNMKTCSACNSTKPLSDFHKHPNTISGLASQCKECDKAGRRMKTKEKKLRLIEMLGGDCSSCGYNKCTEALELHHNGDKESHVSIMMKLSFDKILVEAKKCVLLCANCHREHHASEKPEIKYNGKIKPL